VAESLFSNSKFTWCLFVGHLVLEKVLKAIYIQNHADIPPRTHNLLLLAKSTNLNLSEEQLKILADVNSFNIEARYPDYKLNYYKICSKEFTKEYFTKIKELYTWILSNLK